MMATLSPFVLLLVISTVLCAALAVTGVMGPLTTWLEGKENES